MTTHATFLELAAAGIDFVLSASEQRRLDAHLAGCPACARSAAALRHDAFGFAHLPPVTLPERRGAAILAAAMQPEAVRHPLRLVLVAALLALLALGSLVVGAELLRRSQHDLAVVVPVPTASPAGPDATATPPAEDPTATPAPGDATQLSWARVGDAPADSVHELVGFSGGYVARAPTLPAPGVYFSPDGLAWQAIRLPGVSIKGARAPSITALASSGAQVLAVGGYGHDPCRATDQGGGPACDLSPMAWVTDDGVTWRRSDPWALPAGVAERKGGADASAAWAVAGGWEAARVTWNGASSRSYDVWRSADGISWELITRLGPPGHNAGHGVAVAEGGTRVRWDNSRTCPAEGVCQPLGLLRTSGDGVTWTGLDTFPGAGTWIAGVAPPVPGRRSTWAVAGGEVRINEVGGIDTRVPRILTSSDLAVWTAVDLDVPEGTEAGILGLASSGDRLLAVNGEGLAWASTDGITWTVLADHRAVGLVAAGPAGIIGMPEPGWDGDSGTWLLGE